MIHHLEDLLDVFPGASNQTRCFLHILSITAKAIIKQFDVPKAKDGVVMDQAAQALARLAQGLDVEEEEVYYDAQESRDDEVDDRPLDRWVDLHDGVTDEQWEEIDASIQPVRSMLTKVRVNLISSGVEFDLRSSYASLHTQ
jgi:hypothetical protein